MMMGPADAKKESEGGVAARLTLSCDGLHKQLIPLAEDSTEVLTRIK